MKDFMFCTSWDDGNAADLRVAEMLDGFGLKGSFFIPMRFEKRTLTDHQITDLSENHEIGSHSTTHPDLTKLSGNALADELSYPLVTLSTLSRRSVRSLAYPFGAYNLEVAETARKVGYSWARTTYASLLSPFSIGTGACDPMMMHPTDHLFHQSFSPMYAAKQLLRLPKTDLLRRGGIEALVSLVEERGRFLHLWGHSWAIEGNKQWERLKAVFELIAKNTSAKPVTFAELVERTTGQVASK